jgi:predicted ATPase/class 3 adenylate cyclase/Tfp pilus assembly protein PilF
MPDSVPTGIVSLMFTDIEDSSGFWDRMGDAFQPLLTRHDRLVREAIACWGGYEVKAQGDSFMVAFARGTDAVQCALHIQRALADDEAGRADAQRSALNPPIRARIGIHTGEPFLGYDPGGRPDYFGPVVNRAARIAAAGHGGQILVSAATHDVVQGALTRDFQLLDLGRHRLRGLELPEQLYEVRHPALPAGRFPPLRTLVSVRTNLPAHLSTFVGREKELAELRQLLEGPAGTRDGGCRLLTITGPGGAGKTRLAHELAAECAGRFPDGAWCVDLGNLSEPGGLLAHIASALQLPLLPNQEPDAQLLAFVRDRALLLLLDGFERALAASLRLLELLRGAPGVKCLVTPQAALRVSGEQVYSLPPLQLPDISAIGAFVPERLLRCDSVTLFVERARAVRPNFAIEPANAREVAALCRRLDGLPLAIELAAAQIVELSVPEVLEGLDDRLDSLASDSPDLPERHRTLGAVIGASCALLSPAEQAVLWQLSVFEAGFTRQAAQAVCRGTAGGVGGGALRALVRHSLLQTTEAAGRTRYFLLETVRHYARARLAAEPEVARAAAERHARYTLAFAEPRVGAMRTPEEGHALAELEEDLDNLRAAMDWARGAGDSDLCARLAVALYEPLYRRGYWEEAGARLEAGESASAGDPATHARILLHRAGLAFDTGNLTQACRQAERGLELWRELAEPRFIAEALNLLASIASEGGDAEGARRRYQSALDQLDPGDHTWRGIILNNLARLASRAGQAEEARRLYEEALAHRRAAGDARGEAEVLGNLGAVAHKAGRLAEARRLHLESLARYRALQAPYGIAVTLNNLGELAEQEGSLEIAAPLFHRAAHLFRELGSQLAAVPEGHLTRLRAGAESANGTLTWESALEGLAVSRAEGD